MKTIHFKVRSTVPLMMHNEQAVNPRNVYAKRMKEITSKRKKTEEDLLLLSEIEWESGLYWNEKEGYHLPERVISATLLGSAKQFKLGTQFKQGVLMLENSAPLKFAHEKKKPSDLFKVLEYVDFRGVRVGQAKVMRTRPIFHEWESEFSLAMDEQKFNEKELVQIVENAGRYVGLCEYRPKYGRFEIVEAA